ncbi:MAG TPA: hypothetical protein VJU15_06885 [Gemmatimonadales bacterium]|nr:hypothetical protein [Gemmatimonadales bacterium]
MRLRFAVLTLAFANSAHAQGPLPSAEGRVADLKFFRAEFMAKDRSYSADARKKAEDRLSKLETEAAGMTQVAFDLELARIVAIADNGHTAYFASTRSWRKNRVPLRLVPFGEEFYVLHADDANRDLVGARVDAIDDRSIGQFVATARMLSGGTSAWRDRSVPYFLESPEQMYALKQSKEPGQATYRFTLPGGKKLERRLVASVDSAANPWPGRWLYDQPNAVWAFQQQGTPFRWRDAPEIDGMVIELRQTYNAPNLPIRVFLDSMRTQLTQKKPRNLVLDLRMNGGGDLNTTRDFLQALPGLVPGRIFVLTSPWTFSAAISSTGYLKQAGKDRVTIVGEMVGDRLEFFSEGRTITLPNSGGIILYATERHDYKTGCKGFTDCHGPVVRNPIAVPTLEPEIKAPWTIESWLAGRDPGMAAVEKALKP